MKVLLIFGHPDRVEANLILGLKAAGLELQMTCDPIDQYRETLILNGIQITDLKLKSRVDPKSIATLRKLLKSGQFDIVHSFSSRALSNSLIAGLGINVQQIAYRGTSGHLSRFDPAAWLSYLNPRVSKIICVSNAVKTYLGSRKIPVNKLVTIYKGHNPSWYQAAQRKKLVEFGIPEQAMVIGCSANMRKVKGMDLLIKAFNQIGDTKAHLLLVGEVRDPLIYKLHNASTIKDQIHLVGFRDDAQSLMGACDIFVMPSREREGLPKAVIEAMSLGVAAIVSDTGGMPEIIEHLKSGLVVPAGDVNALAEAILLLINDATLRKELAAAGRNRVRDNFSIGATIGATIKLYQSCLASPPI